MRHVRRLFAFALALVMAFGFMLPAIAANGDLNVDSQVTVTGFESGDTVTAYHIIEWKDGEGWELADGITGIDLEDIVDGLNAEELGSLASAVATAVSNNKITPVQGATINDTTWTLPCNSVATAGSYLILVTSNNAEHVYNPAVVSADFNGTNSAAVDLTEDEATLKKQDVTVSKVADNAPEDYSVQVGDIIPFTVTVTVPQYNSNWTEPYFAVSDVLSTGLTIETNPTIEGLTAGTDYTLDVKNDKSGFTIQFSDKYLKENATASVDIKYSAKVGEAVMDTAQVHEETNTVTLEFSNNPSDSSDHKTVTDETHHYTFAIDAARFGSTSDKTNELIKVGVDEGGNAINAYIEGTPLPAKVSALAGAEFTLTGVAPNGGANDEEAYKQTATSDADGRIFFNNLEVGTYTLKETKAPNGYIMDTTEHTVVITATYDEDGTLTSYTITIDGKATSTYSVTTDEETKETDSDIDSVAPGNNQVFPINNSKGTSLPSTGGIGTTIFYIVGGVMVAGAAIFLLTKRRVTAE